MVDCPTCGKPLEPPTVECTGCGAELHRGCAKKVAGRWSCPSCYKRAKRETRFELMAQRAATFTARKPGKTW